MFGISGEHILILGIILLFFGPKRLPQLGNTLGKAMKNFKDAVAGIEEAEYRKLEAKTELAQNFTQNTDTNAANSNQTAQTNSHTNNEITKSV